MCLRLCLESHRAPLPPGAMCRCPGCGQERRQDREDHLHLLCCPPNLDSAFSPATRTLAPDAGLIPRYQIEVKVKSNLLGIHFWQRLGTAQPALELSLSAYLLLCLPFCASGIERPQEHVLPPRLLQSDSLGLRSQLLKRVVSIW